MATEEIMKHVFEVVLSHPQIFTPIATVLYIAIGLKLATYNYRTWKDYDDSVQRVLFFPLGHLHEAWNVVRHLKSDFTKGMYLIGFTLVWPLKFVCILVNITLICFFSVFVYTCATIVAPILWLRNKPSIKTLGEMFIDIFGFNDMNFTNSE